MTQLSEQRQPLRGRIFPKSTMEPAELHSRKASRVEIGRRCRAIFERIRPELIEKHYNWFVALDADSKDYIIDPKIEGLLKKIGDRYANPDAKLTIFRLNETGTCGTI